MIIIMMMLVGVKRTPVKSKLLVLLVLLVLWVLWVLWVLLVLLVLLVTRSLTQTPVLFSEKQDAQEAAKLYMDRCFKDFGKGLIISLERSCYPVLSAMDGKKCGDGKCKGDCHHCTMNGMYCESKQSDVMKFYAWLRTKHNNHSEGPFATAKEIQRSFTTMRLCVVEGLVLASRNKTFAKGGYFYSLPENIQEAVRIVAKDKIYKREQKFRLERHWTEKFEHLEGKRKEKRKQVQERAAQAEIAFNVPRLKTVGRLTAALNKCKKGKKQQQVHKTQYREVLLNQVRHRLVGCGFEYSFETSLLSNVPDRWRKLETMLKNMMKEENTVAGKIKYRPPDMPHVKNIYKFDVPILGRKSQLRGDIETTIQMKSENLVEMEDNAELVAHRIEFIDQVFFDDGDGDGNGEETRIIVDVQWDRVRESWQAVTRVVNRDGSLKPPGSRPKEEHYLIGNGLRQMIEWHEENLVNDEIKKKRKADRKRKREEKEARKRKAKEAKKAEGGGGRRKKRKP